MARECLERGLGMVDFAITSSVIFHMTVDGQNPAPVGMDEPP